MQSVFTHSTAAKGIELVVAVYQFLRKTTDCLLPLMMQILEVCQTGFRRAFQEGCGKLCQAQEVVSFSARENSAARKAICQKFKAMLPRPSMWNVCIDGKMKRMLSVRWLLFYLN